MLPPRREGEVGYQRKEGNPCCGGAEDDDVYAGVDQLFEVVGDERAGVDRGRVGLVAQGVLHVGQGTVLPKKTQGGDEENSS